MSFCPARDFAKLPLYSKFSLAELTKQCEDRNINSFVDSYGELLSEQQQEHHDRVSRKRLIRRLVAKDEVDSFENKRKEFETGTADAKALLADSMTSGDWKKLFFVKGKMQITKEESRLFYRTSDDGNGAAMLQLPASPKDLERLMENASPAGRGRGSETVYDPKYRTAHALPPGRFSMNFSPMNTSIPSLVKSSLAKGSTEDVRIESYMLNVYGKGGHFKKHKDTPMDEKMIGSLVVCLPGVHEGGVLKLNHEGVEELIDFSTQSHREDIVQWTAFYSNVEHEISEVTSGHRLTLTYNIFLGARAPHTSAIDTHTDSCAFRTAIASLLEDATFLPDGGLVGFPLSHEYVISIHKEPQILAPILKGPDRLLFDICVSLPVHMATTKIMALYNLDNQYGAMILAEQYFSADYQIESLSDFIEGMSGETYVVNVSNLEDLSEREMEMHEDVLWVKDPADSKAGFDFGYITYGNEPSLTYEYAKCVLILKVSGSDQRLGIGRGGDV